MIKAYVKRFSGQQDILRVPLSGLQNYDVTRYLSITCFFVARFKEFIKEKGLIFYLVIIRTHNIT